MKISMNLSRTLAAAGMFVATSAFGQMDMKPSAADMKFAMTAAAGGMEEVELGKLAVQKGKSDKVKQFGQKMIDDHTKANDDLKAIAAKKNMNLPATLPPTEKAMVDKFAAMPDGAAFDKAYMADMVKDHTKDVADFTKEANGGMDPDLKSFASDKLPTLKEHLKMAKEGKPGMMSMH